MDGYEVLTVDDDKVGHVIEEDGDLLIVEHGLLKTKHALPRTFVEIEPDGKILRTTLSKQLIHDSPKVGDGVDHQEIAEYYGLAEGYEDPVTRGAGDLLPDDPARSAEEDAIRAGVDPVQERLRVREGMTTGHGDLDRGNSPGITGGDRFRDAPGG
jgi:hypothetical protein